MNILTVNTTDIQGGAARAAYRLHKALIAAGVNSQMLVQTKASDDHTVIGFQSKVRKGIARLRPNLDHLPVQLYKQRTRTLFSPAFLPFSGIVDQINRLNPDIVHLHWVVGGMLRIEEIHKINAPVVWSLHDMWAFTGGCHYNEGCEKYLLHCGSCLVLGSRRQYDLSWLNFVRKRNSLHKHPQLIIVGLSQWMTECALNSYLFKNNRVVTLPNPIDTSVYAPMGKRLARELLGLPKDKKLIAFGAINAIADPRKGFHALHKALLQLDLHGVELLVFGSSQPKSVLDFGFKTHYLGHLHDDLSLRVLYSAADVMVVPSLQEAFGQTASEPMACGTPVVAFGHTGLLDIIDHKENGYLAKPLDSNDLANGIAWIMNANKEVDLSLNARNKVLKEFDSNHIARQYIELYQSIL